MKRLSLISTLLLLFIASAAIGQTKTNYYYYQGEKIFLDLNTNNISIALDGEKAVDLFKANKKSATQLSEIIEDYARSMVKANDAQAEKRQKIQTFYLEVAMDEKTSNAEYNAQIEAYSQMEDVILASPTFTLGNQELGLSNNFHVKLKSLKDVGLLYERAREMGVEVLGQDKFMPQWFTLAATKSSKGNALSLANEFFESTLFEAAEPGFVFHDIRTSNDSFFGNQWSLLNTGQSGGVAGTDINAEQAWGITTGNNIKVAVLDQGFDMSHPDLQANVFGNGYDAQTGTSPSIVRGSHGTPCAGIIAAVKDNNLGVAGVAPDADIISISTSLGFGATSQILANGINWAVTQNVDIISNSWGGGSNSTFINDAVTNALNNGRGGKGTVVAFSSGNGNVNGAEYPSNSNPDILCVGAIDRCGIRSGRINFIPQSCEPWGGSSASSYGTPLDIVAGGSGIASTDRQGSPGYSSSDYTQNFGGTSAACPMAAGVAALVLSADPTLTVQEVNSIIQESAQKVRTDMYSYNTTSGRPDGTWNNELGHGFVDAHAAVLLAQGGGGNCGGGGGTQVTGCGVTLNVSGLNVSLAAAPSSSVDIIKIRTASWSYQAELCNNYTSNSCVAGASVSVPSAGSYVMDIQGNPNCTYTFQVTGSGGGGGAGDADMDGVCSDVDCDDNDASVGAQQTPGTTCDDGDPNTTNDVILADGCTCQGTSGCNLIPDDCSNAAVELCGSLLRVTLFNNNIYQITVNDVTTGWNVVETLCADWTSGDKCLVGTHQFNLPEAHTYSVQFSIDGGGNCSSNQFTAPGSRPGNTDYEMAFPKRQTTLADASVTLFPNPVTETLNIQVGEAVNVNSLSLYAISGVKMLEKHNDFTVLDMKELPKGVYFITVETNDGVISKRVVKN